FNTTTDPSGDGRYEAAGMTNMTNFANLDILESSMSKPATSDCHPSGTACYRVKMTLSNLSLLPPGAPDPDTDLVWLTQWFVPADPNCTQTNRSCMRGGKKFFVYAESTAGALVRCFSGENNAQLVGGGVTMTYPGMTQITAAGACSVVIGAKGKITIDVPGANTAHGTSTTDANGQAQFCYTGIAAGNDSISAFADSNGNGTQDAGEPSDTASKTWVAPPTNCEAQITQGGQITTDHGDV